MTISNKDPFSIARDALALIGQFKTPPTPTTFEVWYRFIEGSNEDLEKQLSFAVNESKSVKPELLTALHAAFCENNLGAEERLSDDLASELAKIHALVQEQDQAGDVFGGAIDDAKLVLDADSVTTEELISSVQKLSVECSDMKTQLDKTKDELVESQARVNGLRDELSLSQKSMMTDFLTGIGNRRYFESMLRRSIDMYDPDSQPSCLLLFDIDEFKIVNDSFGHDIGDRLIEFVAKQLESFDENAAAARLGGDEFALFLKVANRDEAEDFTANIREHFSTHNLHLAGSKEEIGNVTFSVGAAFLRPSDDANGWYKRADDLMYEAKNLGGNRAVVEKRVGG